MASKIFFSALASVLFVQAAYSQCACNGNLGGIGFENNVGYGNNLGYGNLISPRNFINAGAAVISSNNCGLIGNNLGLVSDLSYAAPGSYEVFSVNSASPAYQIPAGVAISSENQIGGQVAVGGAVPFLGAAYFGGEVASGGEGVLSYGAGPAVSLNGGGCGYGLGAGIYNNNGFSGFGGASVISNGYGGSIVNSGLSGTIGGCSCNQGLYL